MPDFLSYAPLAATVFAVPQFVPQIHKLRATRDTAGISWAWAALTGLNNASWIAYFAMERDWTALIPSISVTLLAGALAAMLGPRSRADWRPAALICGWAAALVAAYCVAGRAGFGAMLTAAFILQVAPSIAAAYRTAHPTGISAGTWLLILGELFCWLLFGLYKADPRLIVLGATGVAAGLIMLARIYVVRTVPGAGGPTAPDDRKHIRDGPAAAARR